jgi:hypothetical protein
MRKCLWLCADKFPLDANFLSQYSHMYGLNPVCVLMWIVKYDLALNVLPQSSIGQINSLN